MDSGAPAVVDWPLWAASGFLVYQQRCNPVERESKCSALARTGRGSLPPVSVVVSLSKLDPYLGFRGIAFIIVDDSGQIGLIDNRVIHWLFDAGQETACKEERG